jgi:hypothetical protein
MQLELGSRSERPGHPPAVSKAVDLLYPDSNAWDSEG